MAAVDPGFAEALGVDQDLAQQMFDRLASPDCDRWYEQVHRAGCCARPIRLQGTVWANDGSVRYTTRDEPDGQLLKRCGSRRRTDCPSCSWLYAGDTWQMINAGLCGGRKGVPDTVAAHPMALITLTAPGFGPVHSANGSRCRPRRDRPLCPHGRPLSCMAEHAKSDACAGEPLCGDCYDYEGAVLFNFRAGELRNRFCQGFRRALAAQLGVPTRRLGARRASELREGRREATAGGHPFSRHHPPRPGRRGLAWPRD
jgi:hypothetical protein